MEIVIKPQNVCSREMHVEYNEENVITHVDVIGGCNGNLQGISALLVGMKADEVIKRLEGIKCRGSRTQQTSCPDQLAQGLKEIVK